MNFTDILNKIETQLLMRKKFEELTNFFLSYTNYYQSIIGNIPENEVDRRMTTYMKRQARKYEVEIS